MHGGPGNKGSEKGVSGFVAWAPRILHRHDGCAPVTCNESPVDAVLPAPHPAPSADQHPTTRWRGADRSRSGRANAGAAGRCVARSPGRPPVRRAGWRRAPGRHGPRARPSARARRRFYVAGGVDGQRMRDAAMAGVDHDPAVRRRRPGRCFASRRGRVRRWRRSRSLRAALSARPAPGVHKLEPCRVPRRRPRWSAMPACARRRSTRHHAPRHGRRATRREAPRARAPPCSRRRKASAAASQLHPAAPPPTTASRRSYGAMPRPAAAARRR